MTNFFSCEPFSILRGNTLDVLKQLQTKVDGVVTSPPYYQQRRYGPSSSELGRESSVGEYIANLVTVFKAIPIEPWVSIWVNLGDKRGKKGELLRIPHLFTGAMAEAGFFLIDDGCLGQGIRPHRWHLCRAGDNWACGPQNEWQWS
jgi:DNA modification methylase